MKQESMHVWNDIGSSSEWFIKEKPKITADREERERERKVEEKMERPSARDNEDEEDERKKMHSREKDAQQKIWEFLVEGILKRWRNV